MVLHGSYVTVVQGSVGRIIDVRRDDFFDGCVGGSVAGSLSRSSGYLNVITNVLHEKFRRGDGSWLMERGCVGGGGGGEVPLGVV